MNSCVSTESRATSCAWSTAHNVHHPTEVYRFFKQIKAPYIGFLPLVEPQPDIDGAVSSRTVPSEAFGAFLCTIFDEWMSQDIGQVKIQIFEEAAENCPGTRAHPVYL